MKYDKHKVHNGNKEMCKNYKDTFYNEIGRKWEEFPSALLRIKIQIQHVPKDIFNYIYITTFEV